MPAYLGPIGGLIPLRGMKASAVTSVRDSTDKVTLGGRLKIQRGLRSRREWSVSTHGLLRPQDTAGLLALDAGGTPPWVWVDPYAQVTNMFTPEQSVLRPGTWGGTGVVEGGSAVAADGVMAVRTILHASGGYMEFGYRDGVLDSPPVIPGIPITYSLYVRGEGSLNLSYRDWSGAALSERNDAYSHSTFARESRTTTPPAGAASVYMWVTGALQAGNPALTWTPAAAEWGLGHGCKRAVVQGLSEAVQYASRDTPGLRRSGISFTVREVG
ncbi:hypothetical protein QFZ79_002888 [Arthrobacter sp. V4I6]|uniref:hypothetical protein n=1 Tax=Arthrobacter sp. V4I6 TaxID=3042281 RepID=UPI0027846AEC|nr:hypothetical protein [Arthrobacter sp. V4I6]MDQ0854777.1 hypothetical protein [Arthrobacter sp. V4I6]